MQYYDFFLPQANRTELLQSDLGAKQASE